MKKIAALSFVFLFFMCMQVYAQGNYCFVTSTEQYAEKNGQKLYLDRYSPAVDTATDTPCIIFVFGGAFARGQRDAEKYLPYFNYFVSKGYTVISIDYRLGLKDIDGKVDASLNEARMLDLFSNSVDMAVEDLFDATNYVLERADQWNIDPQRIIANGSSAGAVTVLQAAYAISNDTMSSDRLPRNFRYAGIVSFAGAILTLDGPLHWNKTPSPMLLFHGNADIQVPYDTLLYGKAGLYGAKAVAESLKSNNYPYHFYSYNNYGHEISSRPLSANPDDILRFFNSFLWDRNPAQMETYVNEIGRPEAKKDYDFFDYVKGNFAR